jgi:hypothetical protein
MRDQARHVAGPRCSHDMMGTCTEYMDGMHKTTVAVIDAGTVASISATRSMRSSAMRMRSPLLVDGRNLFDREAVQDAAFGTWCREVDRCGFS